MGSDRSGYHRDGGKAQAGGGIPQRREVAAPRSRHSIADWLPLMAFVAVGMALAAGYRAHSITVSLAIDERVTAYRSHASTVADLLLEQHVDIAPGDLVAPPPETRLRDGDHIEIQRARAVRVRVDGREIASRSHGRSALAALQDAGVALGPGDSVKINGHLWPADRLVQDPATLGAGQSPAQPPFLDSAKVRAWLAELPAAPHVAAAAGAATAGRSEPPPADGGADGGVDAAPAITATLSDASGVGVGGTVPARPVDLDGSVPAFPTGDVEWVVDVLRAVPVTIIEDGVAFKVQTAGSTVAEGLAAAGLEIRPGDEVYPDPATPLEGSMRIALWRATPFMVEADGNTFEAHASAATVGEALADAGLALQGRDYSIPPTETPLVANLPVKVVRVHEDLQILEVEVPFETQTQADPELPLDEQRVLQAGQPGLKTQQIRITYENGEPIDREVIEEKVERAAVAQVMAYGTKVIWQTVDTEQGPKQYWRKMRMYATSYSASRAGTPKSAPWYGRTRSGFVLRKGIVATDPRIIPLGMWVYVPGYGVAIAGDTGGGVKNYMIDLGYSDDDYQSWHQYLDVYILERLPPEHQMRWVLP